MSSYDRDPATIEIDGNRQLRRANCMEELLELKDRLFQGDIPGALVIVEDLEEISRDDKVNNIRNSAKVLLLHLIKQQAESRTTRSWDVSIRNSALEIQSKNKRRKAGGYYLQPE